MATPFWSTAILHVDMRSHSFPLQVQCRTNSDNDNGNTMHSFHRHVRHMCTQNEPAIRANKRPKHQAGTVLITNHIESTQPLRTTKMMHDDTVTLSSRFWRDAYVIHPDVNQQFIVFTLISPHPTCPNFTNKTCRTIYLSISSQKLHKYV